MKYKRADAHRNPHHPTLGAFSAAALPIAHLCLNITAGSMFAEVIRTTWRISLAIIRSFSKFTSPSTLESLPA